jgi:hypothetical protein
MRLWRRTKAAVAVVAAMALMYGVAGAANLCTLTGNLTLVDGQAGPMRRFSFRRFRPSRLAGQ